jgi:hypothetical protein
MNTSDKPKPLPRLFKSVGFCFLAFGFFFSLIGGYETYQGVKTKSWPAVEGKITHSKIESHLNKSSKRKYSINIEYTYMIGDFMHRGENLRYGDNTYSSQYEANQAQRPWLKGKKVKVFYDPENPESSVLKTGMGLSWLVVGFGMVFVILGLYLMRMGKKPTHGRK